MLNRLLACLGALFALSCVGCSAPHQGLILAHRGASAYLPEHTLEAYALAFAQGADYIEPDVVLTRDGVLICAHDLVMEEVTDVAVAFPGRARPDGKWYWIDFTFAEIKTLHKTGRGDAEAGVTGYTVATLDEMLTQVARLNSRLGKNVGVIPEPKKPSFHREQGQDLEAALASTLRRHGYTRRTDRAIIQCFELDALERLRHDLACDLQLVYLVSDMPDASTLDRAAAVADGLGPKKTLIEDEHGQPVADGWLLRACRERNLAVYPWTFGGDERVMTRFLRMHRVTGLFTDNPDAGVRAKR